MSILGGILGGSALQATGSLMGMGNSFVGGAISNYWNEKQAALNYKYAERYARNSPSWNVAGLRNAGLNPILAATGGQFSGGSWTPSSASVASVNPVKGDPLAVKQLQLLDAEIEGQKIRNENERKNRGLSGNWAGISRILSEAEEKGSNAAEKVSSFIQNTPLFTVEKRADFNEEPYSDDERKALRFYEILLDHGISDGDIRDHMGEEGYEHLERAWAKRRRNERGSRSSRR